MKILCALAFLPLFLIGFLAKAQPETVEPKSKKLQQLYLSLGKGWGLTSAKDLNNTKYVKSANLTASFRNDFITRVGYLPANFADKLYGVPNREELNNTGPSHFLSTIYLSIGKKKTISKTFQVQALTGLTYTKYHEPYDITFYPSIGYNGVYIMEFQTSVYHKPGIILQAETMLLPLRFAGLTLGGYYHFVPKISNGGFTASLNLGRIRTKEIL